MKLRSIVLTWDFVVPLALVLLSSIFLPHWVKNDFAKDLYGVGITVLSVIFPIFFAAVAIIMASSDDEFVRFLDESGDYGRLIGSMRFTLTILFFSLVSSLALYSYSSYRISAKIEHQSYYWLLGFIFLFSWALGAAFAATIDAIKYSLYRSRFLRLVKQSNPDCASNKVTTTSHTDRPI